MKEDIEIYKKLKQLRKERGLTLATLADRIGSDYQQLSRIERGKSRLTVDTLVRMAEAFDTPIDELFKAESKKRMPVLPKPILPKEEEPSQLIQEGYLSEILEKLETVLKETNACIGSQAKAALACQIYQEALQMPRAIDFAISIIKSALLSK